MKKGFYSSPAQGMIEYLVILGIIMVVSLVVVIFLWNTTSPENVGVGVNQMGGLNQGGISIADALVSADGSGFISLKNNSEDILTITKITLDGVENDYNSKLKFYSKLSFSLEALENACSCTGNWGKTKTCNAEIYYNTQDGLQKKYTYSIIVDCAASVALTPDTNAIEPIYPPFEGVCSKHTAGGYFFNGEGTLASPYGLCDCEMLQDVNNSPDANYILLQDIDCSATSSWSSGAGFYPIVDFSGTFDGNSKTISGLFIDRESLADVGFFANITAAGIVENTMLTSADINGGLRVGGIAGSSAGRISYSSFSGDIVGSGGGGSGVGGIVGFVSWPATGTINNSYSEGTIYCIDHHCGGIVGLHNGAGLYNNYSTIDLTAPDWPGPFEPLGYAGLVGFLNWGSVVNNYSAGDVIVGTSRNGYGGLLGVIQSSSMLNSFSSGYVNGADGTTIGYYTSGSSTDSFALADVNGDASYFYNYLNPPLAYWGTGYSNQCYKTYYNSCAGTATECNTTNYGDADACNTQNGCTGTGSLDCHSFDNTDESTCETDYPGCTWESSDCGDWNSTSQETCEGNNGCTWTSEYNMCTGTYPNLCNGEYYTCTGTPTACNTTNFTTTSTCNAQDGCTAESNGNCHEWDATSAETCEGYEGCKAGTLWDNSSGNKYCTPDGNWCLCNGAGYPWLAWENNSC